MHFADIQDFADNSEIHTDICIVGSGPAGISVAKEFLNTEFDVCIVESGGRTKEPETQSLSEIENIGIERRMPQELVRQRVYGGSSTTWSGRCASFDPIDFASRDWIPNSGWPIKPEELNPYLERANEYLGLGPNIYDESLFDLLKLKRPKPEIDNQYLKPTFWQFSKSKQSPGKVMVFGQDLVTQDTPNLRTILHANLVHINTDDTGARVESLDLKSLEGKKLRIKAKTVVLCCGGIENARLLLASNKVIPEGVGNKHDTVGRYLMDHIGAAIGTFDPSISSDLQSRFGRYWLDNRGTQQSYLHGIALSEKVQTDEKLLNAAAFLEEYVSPNDPWNALKRFTAKLLHGKNYQTNNSDDENMFWLDDSFSSANQKSISFGSDCVCILANIPSILKNLYRKKINHRPPITKNAQVDLYTLIEQSPKRESRITLSSQIDALGMPISKINWVIDEKERTTARRLGEIISSEFKRIGLTPPILAQWLFTEDNWQSNFTDRAHPTGSTRMSADPKEGVVDSNCNVHGVEGLFIAGSSIFPTSGHANPTLMIVAMAIRLADWLKTTRR